MVGKGTVPNADVVVRALDRVDVEGAGGRQFYVADRVEVDGGDVEVGLR